MKKRIVILFGGQSSEYAVSLESAASVIEHLDKQRYEPYLIGITTKGEWFNMKEQPSGLLMMPGSREN